MLLGFLFALIDSPKPGVQAMVQPKEPLEIPLRIFHRTGKPGHRTFIGRKSIQAHHLEPGSLSGLQGGYPSSQPVPSLFVLAYHNGCPFSPVGIDNPVGEPFFRGHPQAGK
jgi:hypothetical protein